jgi:hypothetical protein
VSDAKKRKGRGALGRRKGELGRLDRLHALAREEGRRPRGVRGLWRGGEKEMGWLEKGRGERKRGFLLLKKILFKFIFFKLSNLIKPETMNSNHDAQSLIISNFI